MAIYVGLCTPVYGYVRLRMATVDFVGQCRTM